MSARMLRRALRERESQIDEDEDQDDAAATGASKESAGPSLFSLLAAQDGEEEEEEEVELEETPSISKPDANLGEKNKSKNKTKKKKNKTKKNAATSKLVPDKEEESDEILSKLLENVSVQQQEMDKRASVISVEVKDLRPKEELRLLFGSRAIHSVEKSARQRQGRVSAPRSGRKCLVVPMGNWPRWDGGVSMELVHTKDGVMTFRYVYSADYLEVQKGFEACVSSHDPNRIASLLLLHPYHTDSLLALADVYKHIGEHQQAATLLERCLYALECAWSPLFDPLAGKSRLEYSCKENRPLFSALFNYMQHLGRRGCHRTAMEFCKVLLSLDLDDPTGARFCIDYYALRAGQYSWLETFVESFYDDQSVALLPNFSFSLAVARYYLEQKEGNPSSEAVPASELLQQALMLHPSVLSKIVSRAPIKEDAAWSKVLKHRHFARATPGGPSLEHLINIYIERNHLIWRVPELQAWLKDAAVAVCEASGGASATWACARAEAFQADHNEYQHLSVSEFSDRTPILPPDEDAGAGAAAAVREEARRDEEVPLVDRNALAVFVESLLPWMNYGGGAAANADDEDSDQA